MRSSAMTAALKDTWYLIVIMLVLVVCGVLIRPSKEQGRQERQDAAAFAAGSRDVESFRPDSLPEPATRRLTKKEQAREVIEGHQERLEEKPDANESASLLQAMGNMARMKLGEYAEAAAYYEQVLTNYPDWQGIRGTYTNLAVCYERLGDELRVQSVYKRMMKAFPEDSQEYLFAKSELGL